MKLAQFLLVCKGRWNLCWSPEQITTELQPADPACAGDEGNRTYTSEEQSSQGSVNNVKDLVADEDAEDGEDQQDNEADKENSTAGVSVADKRVSHRGGEQLQTCNEKRTTVKHTTTVMPTAMMTESVL